MSRKCCVCNYIFKWLDSLVFSDKDDNSSFSDRNSAGRIRTLLSFLKNRERSSQCCGLALLWRVHSIGITSGILPLYPIQLKWIKLIYENLLDQTTELIRIKYLKTGLSTESKRQLWNLLRVATWPIVSRSIPITFYEITAYRSVSV